MTTPDEVRWLTPEQLRAWVGLRSVAELLPAALDSQLRRDARLTHFDYQVLAMLSEAPGRTLRMTSLAQRTSATLPRLSHVVERLEARGLVARAPSTDDARATASLPSRGSPSEAGSTRRAAAAAAAGSAGSPLASRISAAVAR